MDLISTPLRARTDGPGPAARGLIALLFRLALGFGLLSSGFMSYLVKKNGPPPGWSAYSPYSSALSPGSPAGAPGAEDYLFALPYLQIGLGVALLLGFLTTVSAGLAGLTILVPSAAQIIGLAAVGPPNDPYSMAAFASGNTFTSPNATALLLAAGVIWLASSGGNPFSVDALVFRRREVEAPRSARARPGEGFPDPLPDHAARVAAAVEFDVDSVLAEAGAGGGEPLSATGAG